MVCRRGAPPAATVIWSSPTARDAATRMTEASTVAAPPIVRDGADESPLLGPLMVEWGDVFREEVLKKWLDPTDCAMLARACWKCREAVASAGLVRAGDTNKVPFKLVAFFRSGELLAWAKDNRCPWMEGTCSLAARHGLVEALQWARALDCPWDEWTCLHAAKYGRLEALVWAREHGCPWDGRTCRGAAASGHLNVLQWARECECPWDETTCYHAAMCGQLETMQWERENGCPCPDLATLFGHAAMSGNIEMAKWFREQGCPLTRGLCTLAAEHGRLELLKWLRERDCPADLRECALVASRGGHNEVMAWLGQFTVDTWHPTTN